MEHTLESLDLESQVWNVDDYQKYNLEIEDNDSTICNKYSNNNDVKILK